MAQQGFARNVFNNRSLGDVSTFTGKVVPAAVSASLLDPATAPPDTTVTHNGTQYIVTLPKGVAIIVDGISAVNGAGAVSAILVSVANGTVTWTQALNTGIMETHFIFLVTGP